MSTQPLWKGSNLEALALELSKELSRRGVKVQCSIGPSEEARNMSPPRIVLVDGDATDETYEEPTIQPDHAVAIWDSLPRFDVVVRGEDVRRAELLRDAFFAALHDTFSNHGGKPIRGKRYGGKQSDQGFSIVVTVEFRVPAYLEEFLPDAAVETVTSSGYVAGEGAPELAIPSTTTPEAP